MSFFLLSELLDPSWPHPFTTFYIIRIGWHLLRIRQIMSATAQHPYFLHFAHQRDHNYIINAMLIYGDFCIMRLSSILSAFRSESGPRHSNWEEVETHYLYNLRKRNTESSGSQPCFPLAHNYSIVSSGFRVKTWSSVCHYLFTPTLSMRTAF